LEFGPLDAAIITAAGIVCRWGPPTPPLPSVLRADFLRNPLGHGPGLVLALGPSPSLCHFPGPLENLRLSYLGNLGRSYQTPAVGNLSAFPALLFGVRTIVCSVVLFFVPLF